METRAVADNRQSLGDAVRDGAVRAARALGGVSRAESGSAFGSWLSAQTEELVARLSVHGDHSRWATAFDSLPPFGVRAVHLDQPCPSVEGEGSDAELGNGLAAFAPWRKGPFRVGGVHVDAEWRLDLKFARFAPHLSPLEGRRILDVGSGNGYACLRLAGAGAGFALGVDPGPLVVSQFWALARYFQPESAAVLPLALEDLPRDCPAFDTVFSLGVIYHRRSPAEHLDRLRSLLVPGGELVIESLVLEGVAEELLRPDGRYAKMRNVWAIPSVGTLLRWLAEAGFRDARVVDVTRTTSDEQRRTEWMRSESLADFLDPCDPFRTVEGYPAPRRAICIARAPARGG